MSFKPTSDLTLQSTIKLNSGYEMPRLGLGVFKSKGQEGIEAVVSALKLGYRHIDSARWYENETEVGEGVRRSGVKREEIFVTTKVWQGDQGYDTTLKAVDESLEKFGFDYIDLYLIHAPTTNKEKRLQTYRALLDAQKAGRIRSIGVSNYGIRHLEEIETEGLPKPSINQIELHPYCQQNEIAKYCDQQGIVVQAYCPLIRGQIGDDAIKEIAASKSRVDPFQVLIRWSLQRGFVPLPKSVRPEKIASNADVYGFELSREEMARIDVLDKGADGAISWNPVDAP